MTKGQAVAVPGRANQRAAQRLGAVHGELQIVGEGRFLDARQSLNHLLARQVIGPESHVEDDPIPGGSFYKNYEHIIMPMVVMGTALVLVAYVPLFFY